MEENSIETPKQKEESVSRALRRKAVLLGTFFGLPKPDINFTSVEKMPEEFNLPGEMVELFSQIYNAKASHLVEYSTSGDVKDGRLFFDKLRKGDEFSIMPESLKGRLEFKAQVIPIILGIIRRRIGVHSHGETSIRAPEGESIFLPSMQDVTVTLLKPMEDITIIMALRLRKEEYEFCIAIKDKENLRLEEERYHSGRLLNSPGQEIKHVSERLKQIAMKYCHGDLQPEIIAGIYRLNGCKFYIGKAYINDDNVKAYAVQAFKFPEFEKDRLTGVVLPIS